ncbi:MAG: AAA family ATPase [bacterium]|nr:AAA family ATPase [bacterium]
MKFKHVPQSYLLNKLLGFWGNMVKNYRADVQDDDFFDILRRNFDHDKAVELIETAYTPEEIRKMGESRSRRSRVDFEDPLNNLFQSLWNQDKRREKCRVILQSIKDYMIDDAPKTKDEAVEKRFMELKRVLKLSDLEFDVLMVAYLCSQTCFSWPCRVEDRDKPLYYAMALDRSYAEVLQVMNGKGRLRKFNLLGKDWDFNYHTIGGFIDGTDSETIERRFYKKNEDAEVLPWDYYGALASKDGEVLKRMLATKPGRCNILLYGAPGTGKTSFARTLAKELGRTAWEIKQGDDDGRNMSSEARMMGIQICNDQEDPNESLMIVDEADELLRGGMSIFDLLFGGGGKSTEKGVMNTLLDEMKIPAVWISNAPARSMDESVRRRFDYSICFEELNNTQRVAIWRNVVKKHGLGNLISEAQIADYAAKYATSAGGISTVLDNVKRLKPAKDEVDETVATLMKPHCKLMDVKEANRFLPAKGYSLEGLNIKGDVRLEKIVTAVRNYMDASFTAKGDDKPRMNLLMFGPPGTGKTEFVKYLGKELDRKVLVMKGSDILGMYVGESEQNIARAFRRAETERAILFFDEIDGLVQSREQASQSWQVSQVNELLQQMENFDGVMIAATNFRRNLDPAIMRRFTFKLEFDYLDDAGKKSFFERMFKTTLTDGEFAELKTINNLAPGDFRTVRQKSFYLDEAQTNGDLVLALRQECQMKLDGDKSAEIGFR